MPKHYKDMIDELINKMDEDGNFPQMLSKRCNMVVDMDPTGGRKLKNKDKYKDDKKKMLQMF